MTFAAFKKGEKLLITPPFPLSQMNKLRGISDALYNANTTLAKKNRHSREIHEVELQFDQVISCDIELQFDTDTTRGICALRPRVAD